MRIIIFGANGGLGQWTWKTALKAGFEVVAFVRSPHKLDQSHASFADLDVVQGDVMNAVDVSDACRGCDIAINCTSPAGGNSTIEMAKSIVQNASAAGVKTFYMVGGLGALWVPGSNKTLLVQDLDDTEVMQKYGLPPGMPKEKIQDMTKGHLLSMGFMQTTGLAHTFLCPGIMAEGATTDTYTVTLDELGGKNVMKVNLADVAKVIVDDLNKGALLGHRVCISSA